MLLDCLAVSFLNRHESVFEVHDHLNKCVMVLTGVGTSTRTVLRLAVCIDSHAIFQVIIIVLGGLEIEHAHLGHLL